MFFRNWMKKSTKTYSDEVKRLQQALESADAVVIGAGAGLSTSAGFTYSGERFRLCFGDFQAKYGFCDMYSGGFYPYGTTEEQWGFWSRNIYINRYMNPPKRVYEPLLSLVKDKDYFVLTTNVDHCFQRAGFDKKRLFYTQGDYGLWQCSRPCHQKTYDNEETVRQMVLSQGFTISTDGSLTPPLTADGETDFKRLLMTVPSELVPRCPVCGEPMSMNLRADDTFVEDKGWHMAAQRYSDFLRRHEGQRLLFLELGVGSNTPGIVKYPFWRMTAQNPKAFYACLNYGEAFCPDEIQGQSICINGDIGETLKRISL